MTPILRLVTSYLSAPMAHGCTETNEDLLIVFTTLIYRPIIKRNEKWRDYNQQRLKAKPLILKAKQRRSIEAAIRETCNIRKWLSQAINVRTNHVHTVVSANRKSGLLLNAFKANATRQLREDGCWPHPFSPWADKGSKRKLWNEQSVAKAIDYVVNGQGDDLPDFDD